uniref:Uncharacterized protein n=1 Tax=Equus caballus TaxID=9796 RepID=A0A9L0SMC1_HORSE
MTSTCGWPATPRHFSARSTCSIALPQNSAQERRARRWPCVTHGTTGESWGRRSSAHAPVCRLCLELSAEPGDQRGRVPHEIGSEFSSSFESMVKKICKYLFPMLGYVCSSHFQETLALELHARLNTLYGQFLFSTKFNLLGSKETLVMTIASRCCAAAGVRLWTHGNRPREGEVCSAPPARQVCTCAERCHTSASVALHTLGGSQEWRRGPPPRDGLRCAEGGLRKSGRTGARFTSFPQRFSIGWMSAACKEEPLDFIYLLNKHLRD